MACCRFPLSFSALEEWLAVRPEMALDGERPTAAQLSDRLASFWMRDEVILYVGLTTRRLSGARKPHSGGYFLKTLGQPF